MDSSQTSSANQPGGSPSKKGMWVAVIVVVVLVLAGSYYLIAREETTTTNNGNTVNTESNSNTAANENVNTAGNVNSETNSNTAVNTNTTANTNSGVDTSGWENYRNGEVGISFNFPTAWDQSYYTEPVRAQYFQDNIFAARQAYDTESASPGYGEILVRAIPNADAVSLNDWVVTNDPITEAETLLSEAPTTVDGENGLYRHATSAVAGGVLDTRYISHGGNIVVIETNSRITTDHQISQLQFDTDAQVFLDSINLF